MDNHNPYNKASAKHLNGIQVDCFHPTSCLNMASYTYVERRTNYNLRSWPQYMAGLLESSTITQALLTPTHQGSVREGG